VIYIFKNDRQSGPYEDHIVLEQLRSGVLSPNDLAVRHGETRWQPLGDIFPEASTPTPPSAPPPLPTEGPATAPGSKPAGSVAASAVTAAEPMYRKTLIQKILFGLIFLGFLTALIASAFDFISMRTSSGDLATDLRNVSIRDVALYATIGLFVGTFFTLLAFILTFKRKIIISNALRLALRIFFILVLLVGLIDFGYGVISYFTYTNPLVSSTKPSSANELTKALEEGEALAGPFKGPVLHIPIAAGLILFGLSGILMTKRGKKSP
jgi:hypothetical protein